MYHISPVIKCSIDTHDMSRFSLHLSSSLLFYQSFHQCINPLIPSVNQSIVHIGEIVGTSHHNSLFIHMIALAAGSNAPQRTAGVGIADEAKRLAQILLCCSTRVFSKWWVEGGQEFIHFCLSLPHSENILRWIRMDWILSDIRLHLTKFDALVQSRITYLKTNLFLKGNIQY